MTNNSTEVFVQDAVGDTYCHSYVDIKYRDKAIAHARWYARQRRHIGFDGKPISICQPIKIVAIDYYDPSSA